jgi:hypothetical protein
MTKRKDADLAEFAKQRESLTESTLTSRRTDVFEDYVGALKSKLEREGKIKVHDDVLARVAEDESVDQPRPPIIPRGEG